MASGLTLDAGALIGIEKRDRRCQDILAQAVERRVRITVPAGVLAQVWRGNGAMISRFLRACAVEPLDEIMAKKVGRLLARAGSSDVVDGAVVLGAASRGDVIVTSDPDDIASLVAAARVEVRILRV